MGNEINIGGSGNSKKVNPQIIDGGLKFELQETKKKDNSIFENGQYRKLRTLQKDGVNLGLLLYESKEKEIPIKDPNQKEVPSKEDPTEKEVPQKDIPINEEPNKEKPVPIGDILLKGKSDKDMPIDYVPEDIKKLPPDYSKKNIF